METTAPPQPAVTIQLTRDFYYLIGDALRRAIPPPASRSPASRSPASRSPASFSPDDIARRDNALIAAVASLRPANADQALLGVQYVAASIRALACLEEAHELPPDDAGRKKCTAQAALMMRQARGARAMLAQFQRHDADRAAKAPGSLEAGVRAEHATAALMTEALAIARASTSPPAPAPTPSPVPTPVPTPVSTRPPFDLAGAEAYAQANPNKAMLIRSLGRLPKRFDDPPPQPGVKNAMIHGASPILQKVYKKSAHRLIAA